MRLRPLCCNPLKLLQGDLSIVEVNNPCYGCENGECVLNLIIGSLFIAFDA
jgi:hypothetical protein